MRAREIQKELKQILGETYGGPSLSYSEDNPGGPWVIFKWFDAPVCTEVLARGQTLDECVANYWKRFKKGRIPK